MRYNGVKLERAELVWLQGAEGKGLLPAWKLPDGILETKPDGLPDLPFIWYYDVRMTLSPPYLISRPCYVAWTQDIHILLDNRAGEGFTGVAGWEFKHTLDR